MPPAPLGWYFTTFYTKSSISIIHLAEKFLRKGDFGLIGFVVNKSCLQKSLTKVVNKRSDQKK